MNRAPTLTSFLRQTGAQIRIFDMGRRVVKIPLTDFERFEQTEIPYPYPLQRSAWLGVLFWDPEEKDQQVVWFIRFPLDEQGLLVQSARDEFVAQFMGQVMEAKQATMDKAGEAQFPELEGESPYAFKPKEERMASFHARAAMAAGEQPSRFYEHARDYFAGKPGWEQWSFLGMQGIADVAARWEANQPSLIAALPQLPAEVLLPLCHCLENESIDTRLSEALLDLCNKRLAKEDVNANEIAALIRAVSLSQATGFRDQLISAVLNSSMARQVEVLVAIAGRAWEALQDNQLRMLYLESLARTEGGQDVFLPVVADLLFIPGMRPLLVESFRSPNRSEQLAQAIGKLF